MSDDNTGTDTAPQGGVQSPSVSPSGSDRPSWLPERFASGEDFARAYSDLERQQQDGQQQQPDANGSPAYDDSIPSNHQDAKALVDNAGLNFDAIGEEYFSSGGLSRETYASLARAGISREIADGYIAGQQALAENIRGEVFATAGGADAYEDMVDWAKSAFSAEEIEGFNASMNSGSIHQMRLSVDGLKARFVAHNGSPPKLLGGQSGSGHGAGDAYASTAEMTAAMRDDRYATDPAYRSAVIAKLGRSNIM